MISPPRRRLWRIVRRRSTRALRRALRVRRERRVDAIEEGRDANHLMPQFVGKRRERAELCREAQSYEKYVEHPQISEGRKIGPRGSFTTNCYRT